MKVCLKPFTLEVASNFWQLVWGATTVFDGTPPAAIAYDFEADSLSCDMLQPPQGGGDNAAVIVNGQFTYTGPAVDCNLHLVTSHAAGGRAGILNVAVDGFNVLEVAPIPDLRNNGTHDYAFTIPESVNAVISVEYQMQIGSFAQISSLTHVATLTTT